MQGTIIDTPAEEDTTVLQLRTAKFELSGEARKYLKTARAVLFVLGDSPTSEFYFQKFHKCL